MAQSFKLIDPANEWIFTESDSTSGIKSTLCGISEDSILIDSKYYRSILAWDNEDKVGEPTNRGYVRQEQDTVFRYFDNIEKKVLIFNLELGDTINIDDHGPAIVRNIDQRSLLNGDQVNIYFLGCPNTNLFFASWLEGIGSYKILGDFPICLNRDYEISLVCFKRNGKVLFQNSGSNICWVTSNDTEVFKMVDPKNEWVYSTTNFFNGNISSGSFQFSEDSTLIGDKYYHELFSYRQENQQGTKYSEGYYSQTNDSIFYSMPEASEGILVYVFNLEIGDTVTLFDMDPLVVDTIITYYLLNGQEIDEYYLECPAFGEINMIYFEGIGSTVQIENTWPCIIFDTGESLLCFKRNNEVLYQRQNQGECWLTSTQELEDIDLAIYPNPTQDVLKIESDHAFKNIELTDMNGRLILADGFKSRINMKGFESGVYFLKLTDQSGHYIVEKVILTLTP